VIPADSLLTRLRSNGHRSTAWQPAPELGQLAPGEVGGFLVAGTTVLACQVGDDVFAYHDRCPACAGSLAGAELRGAVLHCPRCGANYDVVHAGAGIGTDSHLEPIPVLVRDGVLSMAVAQAVAP
jgi:nitrite reductase/ring-hydroxylating ferredoxin subunit